MLKEQTLLKVDKPFIDKMAKIDKVIQADNNPSEDQRTRLQISAMSYDPVQKRTGMFVVTYYDKHKQTGDEPCFHIGWQGLSASSLGAGCIYLNNNWISCPEFYMPISNIPKSGWIALDIDISNGFSNSNIKYTAEDIYKDFSIPYAGDGKTVKYPIARYEYSDNWKTYFITLLANHNIPRIDVWGKCDEEETEGTE